MTDIITTPIAIRRPSLLRLQLPKLAIGRPISKISSAILQAFEMAYVAPFMTSRSKPPVVFDADLEGRDLNW
jgi:hypothetical protein